MGDHVAVMRSGSLVQYATPLELLMSPCDEGVAQLIGSERGLRALALVRTGDLPLEPLVGSPRTIVAADATARETLATLLADEAQEAIVRGGDGEVLGLVTPAVIGRVLRSNSEQTLAHLAEGAT
jgi:osmoprotectant transport system ATP-binding protein